MCSTQNFVLMFKGKCTDPLQHTAGMSAKQQQQKKQMGINSLKAPVFSLQQPLIVTGGCFCSSYQISENVGSSKVAQWYSFHKKQYFITLLIVYNI